MTNERKFTVTLFGETREVTAKAFAADATRFTAFHVVSIRYRTGKQLHTAALEIETNPEEVAKLTSPRFGWKSGDGFAFRVSGHRSYGNLRSALIPVGWAKEVA